MLFEEIEQDVREKDRFITLQIQKLKEINETYQTMLEYLQVLISVGQIIPALKRGAALSSFHGGIVDTEIM